MKKKVCAVTESERRTTLDRAAHRGPLVRSPLRRRARRMCAGLRIHEHLGRHARRPGSRHSRYAGRGRSSIRRRAAGRRRGARRRARAVFGPARSAAPLRQATKPDARRIPRRMARRHRARHRRESPRRVRRRGRHARLLRVGAHALDARPRHGVQRASRARRADPLGRPAHHARVLYTPLEGGDRPARGIGDAQARRGGRAHRRLRARERRPSPASRVLARRSGRAGLVDLHPSRG